MTTLLSGQTVLVTGASRGLGKAIAIHLAAAGARVALVARTREQLEEGVAHINENGGEAISVVADVTDRTAVEAAVDTTCQQYGAISILVNNAGLEIDPDEWWHSHEIHVRGCLLFMSAVLPAMRERKHGRIINMVSKGGVMIAPYLSSYCVSKATAIRLTEHVDQEIKPDGLSAFAIQPGTIITDMARESINDPDAKKWVPFLVNDLQAIIDQDPTDELERLGKQVVALAAGQYDVLSGRYLDLELDIDALARDAKAEKDEGCE